MKELIRRAAIAGVGTILLAGVSFAGHDEHNDNHDEEENAPKSEITSEVDVASVNDADIMNMINAHLSTGDNHADKNDGDGSVDTGDASGTVKVSSTANDATVSVTTPNLCGECVPDEGSVKVKSDVDISTVNDADVNNSVNVCADTGNNTADHNDGNGSVMTGSASVDLSVTNTVNASSVTVN